MQRILITGGSGFIGSHLADSLINDGHSVVVLDDLSTGSLENIQQLLSRPGFRFIEGSVMDEVLVDRLVTDADEVYHLAAAVGVQLIVEQPLKSLLTNIRGTEAVLKAAAEYGVKVLVASTSEVYGKNIGGKPFQEDDDRLIGPTHKLRWSYSVSKSVDEILAFAYFKEAGLPAVIGRLFNTVGPRQSGRYGMVMPRFIGQAMSGEPLTVFGDGKQSRSFTYVADAVTALTRLMAAPATVGRVFNIAGAQEITIEALAELVIRKTGSTSSIVHVPYDRVYGPDFEDMQRRVADTSRLEKAIGYRCSTTIEEMLDRMINLAVSGRRESSQI